MNIPSAILRSPSSGETLPHRFQPSRRGANTVADDFRALFSAINISATLHVDSNTVRKYPVAVKTEYSLEALAKNVQDWCESHGIQPANGQVAEALSERTIRYYRTLGLLDAAPGSYLRAFTEKHRLQLLAIRIHQAQGFPLRRIHEQLYGKSEAELREFARKAGRQLKLVAAPFEAVAPTEHWGVVPLTDDLMIVSRQGRPLPPHLIRRLQTTLAEAGWPGNSETKRN